MSPLRSSGMTQPKKKPSSAIASAAAAATVSLSGNILLVGDPVDNSNGLHNGKAHLFDANTGTLLRTFDDPTPTTFDSFGNYVVLDGNRAFIASRADNTNGVDVGQVHLFDATTGALLHTFDDPTVTGGDVFGESVAMDGNLVLIGAQHDSTNGFRAGR